MIRDQQRKHLLLPLPVLLPLLPLLSLLPLLPQLCGV